MVDDGSTDGSAAIAAVVRRARPALQARQPGQRRPQRGAQHRHRAGHAASSSPSWTATTSWPRTPTSCCVGTLDQTGSDFATGNVHRLTPPGHAPGRRSSRAVRDDAAEDAHHPLPRRCSPTARRGTSSGGARSGTSTAALPGGPDLRGHPGRAPAALRRALGRRASPTPSTTGARARARASRSPSAATEPQALDDRLPAIQDVSGTSPSTGRARPSAGTTRASSRTTSSTSSTRSTPPTTTTARYFIERVNAFLRRRRARASSDRLPAIDRLKWHFVRRRMLPELLEIRRFEQEDMDDSPPRADRRALVSRPPVPDRPRAPHPALALPGRPRPRLHALDRRPCAGRTAALRIEGGAYVAGIGAPPSATPNASRWSRCSRAGCSSVRQRVAGVRVRARNVHRPDEQAHRGDGAGRRSPGPASSRRSHRAGCGPSGAGSDGPWDSTWR